MTNRRWASFYRAWEVLRMVGFATQSYDTALTY